MTIFYLVRHAHAHWQPSEDRPLSERGMKDADRVADILEAYPIQFIYASPYRRAAQTVEPLAYLRNLPITALSDLRERDLAGEPVADFDAAIKAVWRDPTFAHPGGESNVVAQERGIQALNQLHQQHPNAHVVVASHGNLLALILQYFDSSLGYEFWQALQMPDIYRLVISSADEMALTQLWTG